MVDQSPPTHFVTVPKCFTPDNIGITQSVLNASFTHYVLPLNAINE